MPDKAGPLAFLTGGDMAALMRARDWSDSPLGPPEHWPQSLKSVVALMLGSKFPMFVAWGPELSFLYNESYAEILGQKHPAALGGRFHDIWAEIWPDISPLIDAALAGRASFHEDLPLLMNRRGHDEQTWFTFSYSPVRDDDGRIAGMFCACQETTGRVLAEHRIASENHRQTELFEEARRVSEALRESEDHYRHAIELDPQTTWTSPPDGQLDRVNQRWFEWTGTTGLGSSYADGLHADDRQRTIDVWGHSVATGEAYDIEHRVKMRDGSYRWMHSRAYPRRDERGGIVKWYGRTEDIHDRKLAEDERRESEERLRALADNLPIAVVYQLETSLDLTERRYTFVSANSAQLMGVDPESATSDASSWFAGLGAADLPRVIAAEREALAHGRVLDLQIEFRRPDDGGVVNGRVVSRPRSSSGDRVIWDGMFIDITDVKLAEAERDRAAGLLRTFIDAVPGVVYAKDRDGRLLIGNRGVSEVLGKPLDQLIGRSEAEYAEDKVEAAAIAANDRRIMTSGVPEQVEEEIRLPDGSPAVWLSTKEPLRDATGAVVGLVGSSVDVTARRRAEDALREETRTLETLNRVGAALAGELDLERLVQMVSDAGVELTGARFGAFFHNILDESGEKLHLFTLSGAQRADFEKLGGVRATGVFGPTFRNEGVVRSDDILADRRYGQMEPHRGMPPGHLPVRSYMGVPVVSRSGEVLGGLLFGHPEPGRFTERHERLMIGIAAQAAVAIDNARLFQQVQQANETLESRVAERTLELEQAHDALRQSQKMEAVGQLTGGIAHDFNNMLAVTVGSLDLLGRRLGSDDPRARRYLDAAVDGAKRAAQLTQRLLAFSRQQPLRPEPVDVNRLVSGMSDLLRHSLGLDIQLEADLATGLWRTHVDPNQLENAILNLAVNARDAMPDGGKLTITTRNAAEQQLLIAVSDTGAGMSPDVIAKAFDPFFTTKEVGKGTGLGLSQVYGFVRQSGGHVRIRSQAGEGATVEILLPRYEGAEVATHGSGEEPDLALSQAREVVLVVEDEVSVRQFSTDALAELGYRVLEADGAPAALRQLDAHPEISLLFTDVVMPEVNGAKLAEEARRRRPDLKVLFTTGYARDAVSRDGALAPGVELIGKPFSVEELAAKVRDVLDAPVA